MYLYLAYSWALAQIGLVPCPLSAVVFAVGEDLRQSGTLTVRSSKSILEYLKYITKLLINNHKVFTGCLICLS